MITNEQIEELEIKISAKITESQLEDGKRREQLRSLGSLKFGVRRVEDKPAQYKEETDIEDETKKIKVLVRRATMKTVFDIPPMSRDDPTQKLEETVREKRFNEINTLY